MTFGDDADLPEPAREMPDHSLGKPKMRLVTPPIFIRFPARMKKGTASRTNPVVEAYILWGSMVRRDSLPSPQKRRWP